MPSPDEGRFGLFGGILVLSAVVLLSVARLADVSPIGLAPAYMFSPLLAGLVVCWRHNVSVRTVGLRIGRPRWLAVAAVGALPFVGLTLLLAVAVPGVGFDPTVDVIPGIELPPGILGIGTALGLVLGLGTTVNAVFALGEEFGWRGYLLWELAPLGFWRASAAIGTIWGLWHVPIIVAGYNFPSFPYIGVLAITIACLSFSPVYTYLVIRAESMLAAALLHGVFNGSAGIVIAFAVTNNPVLGELVASPVGAAGVLAFGLASIGISRTGTPSLSRESI